MLAIAWMAAACWSASAAELTATLSKENRTIIVLNGALAPGDAARFVELMKTSAAGGHPVSALRLNSPGGSMLEAARLAGIIHGTNIHRGAKIATVIANGATCAGACFIPFIAGSQKYVSATATVCVPGAAEKSGHEPAGETPAVVREETPAIIQVVKKLGLLDAIVMKMEATSEDKVFALSLDDFRAMGVTITGRPTQLR